MNVDPVLLHINAVNLQTELSHIYSYHFIACLGERYMVCHLVVVEVVRQRIDKLFKPILFETNQTTLPLNHSVCLSRYVYICMGYVNLYGCNLVRSCDVVMPKSRQCTLDTVWNYSNDIWHRVLILKLTKHKHNRKWVLFPSFSRMT